LEGKPPLLIFGTDQKLTGRDPFLTLFYHFSNALRECAAIIVVGYSFGDPHINQIVEQRFRENLDLRMLVIAPHASDQVKRHEWLCNPARVTTIDSTAKAAINEKKLLKWLNVVLKAAKEEKPF